MALLIAVVFALSGARLLSRATDDRLRADASWAREAVAFTLLTTPDIVAADTHAEADALRSAAQQIWATEGRADLTFEPTSVPMGNRAALLVSVQGRSPACAIPHGSGWIVYNADGDRLEPPAVGTADSPDTFDCASLR